MQFIGRGWHAPVLAVIACALLGPVDAAHAQAQTPTPSAKELWETYPLHSAPRSGATATPTASATPGRRVSAPAAASDASIDAVVPVLLAALLVAAGLLLGFLTLRSRRAGAPRVVAPDPPAGRLTRFAKERLALAPAKFEQADETSAAQAPADRRPAARKPSARKPAEPEPAKRNWLAADDTGARPRPAAAPLRGGAGRAPARSAGHSPRAAPPDPRSESTAEVDWARTENGARFRVLARTEEHDGATVIAESPPLEWPPTSSTAVEELTRAVDELERTLLAAGWEPRPAGKEWYAKRFAWKPGVAAAAAVPAGAPGQARRRLLPPLPANDHDEERAGRFVPRSAWPDGTEALWRCEIRWRAASGKSRFAAVAYGPGERRGRAVGDPAAVSWAVSGEPDPELEDYRRELRRLAAALHDAGWERLGRGAKWYSARFVWRRTETPPDRLESRVRGA